MTTYRIEADHVTELFLAKRAPFQTAEGANVSADRSQKPFCLVVEVPSVKPNRSFIFEPIKTVGQAMAFITLLQAHSIMWHFDDNVEDVAWGDTEFPPDATELVALNARIDDMVYEITPAEWGEYGCPIGYALFVMKLMDQA